MSDVRVEIGHRYEATSVERRAATQRLVDEMQQAGFSTRLDVVGYRPGRRAMSPVEWTGIFVGTTVGTALISSITTDIYERAKQLLLRRKDSGEPGLIPGRPLGFVIYGPRGEELRRWTTDDVVEEDASETSDRRN
jgi:hypothetical protein